MRSARSDFSATVVTVGPAVEHLISVVVDDVLVRPVVAGHDESRDGELRIAVGTPDVGAAVSRLGAVLACHGPGLEEAELPSAFGTEVSACRDLEIGGDARGDRGFCQVCYRSCKQPC